MTHITYLDPPHYKTKTQPIRTMQSFNDFIMDTQSFGVSLDAITNKELHDAVKKQNEEAQASRQSALIEALNTVCKQDKEHAKSITLSKKSIKANQKRMEEQCASRDRNRVVHALFVSDSDDITPTIRFGCYMIIHYSWDMTQESAETLNKALGVDSPFVTAGNAGRDAEDQKKRTTWVNEVFSKAEALLPEGILKNIRDSQN